MAGSLLVEPLRKTSGKILGCGWQAANRPAMQLIVTPLKGMTSKPTSRTGPSARFPLHRSRSKNYTVSYCVCRQDLQSCQHPTRQAATAPVFPGLHQQGQPKTLRNIKIMQKTNLTRRGIGQNRTGICVLNLTSWTEITSSFLISFTSCILSAIRFSFSTTMLPTTVCLEYEVVSYSVRLFARSVSLRHENAVYSSCSTNPQIHADEENEQLQ